MMEKWLLTCQEIQKSLTSFAYVLSCKSDVVSFHTPGPRSCSEGNDIFLKKHKNNMNEKRKDVSVRYVFTKRRGDPKHIKPWRLRAVSSTPSITTIRGMILPPNINQIIRLK